HHLCEWLAGDAREVLPGWPDLTLTDLAAPAFFVAAGASCALLVGSRLRRGLAPVRVAGVVLRRYGLLVPIGMALEWALWGDPFAFGVLEAIGVTVVAAALVAALLPGDLLTLAAVGALTFGVMVERDVTGQHDWLAVELLGGNFPVVTYLGFVLVGMAVVRSGRYAERRWMASAAVLGVAAVALMLLEGVVPARYPGDIGLVVPGVAGSALLYALCQASWPSLLDPFDRVLRSAAAHTFGIFIGHYAIYWVLRETGVARSVSDLVTVPAAVVMAVLLCLVAPRVPQPPWSPRTGWRRPRAPRPSTGSAPAGGAPAAGDTAAEVGAEPPR
ncbi:MAG TPA: heparan-alpha-glucosaminide N-acetyltransferase domain-containing protein, partial [Acidimicrobiales bacterium]